MYGFILFTEKLLEAKSIQVEVDVIYMDSRKAFDSTAVSKMVYS